MLLKKTYFENLLVSIIVALSCIQLASILLFYQDISLYKNLFFLSALIFGAFFFFFFIQTSVFRGRVKINFMLFCYVVLFLLAATSLAIQMYMKMDYVLFGSSVIGRLTYILFFIFAWFVIGYVAGKNRVESPIISYTIISSILVLLLLNTSGLIAVDYEILQDNISGVYGHLSISGPILTLVFLTYRKDGLYQIIIFLIMLLIGSRSVFYLYIISLLLVYLHTKRENLIFVIVTVFLSMLITLLFFSNSLSAKMLFEQGFSQDGSFLSRLDMLQSALYFLPNQLAYGGYYENVEHYQSFGGYAHNLLSAIQFFGLPFFILLLFILINKTKKVFTSSLFLVEQRIFFYFAILSLFLTNYIGFYFAWFVLGNILSSYEKNLD